MTRIGKGLVPKVLGDVLVGTAGVGGGILYWYGGEGTRRAIKTYSTFTPVVLRYRWVEARRHKYFFAAKLSISSLSSSEEETPEMLSK